MMFQPYDWQEVSDYREDFIYVWALDEKSRNVLIKFTDLPIKCYAYCSDINALKNVFNDEENKSYYNGCRIVNKKFMYYYSKDTKRCLELTFGSMMQMRACIKRVKECGKHKVEYFEDDVSPINKILAIKNLCISDWMKCSLKKTSMKASTLELEYDGNWKTLVKCESTTVTVPKILAYDLETYSEDHTKFPNKFYISDEIYMISCIYQHHNTIDNYALVLWKGKPVVIDNVTVIYCDSEDTLLDKFFDLIIRLDPDIITGWNIYGFDNAYVHERLNIRLRSWRNVSRLISYDVNVTNIDWASSAYGKQELCILNIPGRLSIDMLAVVRRDEPNLEKYNLDYIAEKFINDRKNDVSAKEMFDIYKNYKSDPLKYQDDYIRVLKYCVQDSALVIKIMNKLNSWTVLLETANVMNVTMLQLFTRGQTIRCSSQIYKLAYQKDFIFMDKRDDGLDSYEGASVVKPVPGLYDNVMCLDFASLYPSIIQAMNICHSTLVKDNDVPDEDCNIIEFDETLDNGYVIHHRYRFYKKEIGLLPFLVRQLVAERNKVRQKMKSVDDKVILFAMEARQKALKVSANSMYGMLGSQYKLSLKEGAASITAKGRQLLESVIELVKTEYNGSLVYGDTDSVMFTIPTVKTGKDSVIMGELVAQRINGVKKGDPIPGTDSVYDRDIPGLFPAPLSMEFEKSMRMLSIKKKNYISYIIDMKTGEYKEDANGEKYLLTKGVPLVKKDRSKFLKNIYKDVALAILDGKPFLYSFGLCIDIFEDLLEGRYDLKDLCVYARLGSKYKAGRKKKDGEISMATMQIVADRLKKKGTPLLAGAQIEYLVAKVDDKYAKKGERMFTYEEFVENNMELDIEYYIESLLNSLDELLVVGYSKELEIIGRCCDDFDYGRWQSGVSTKPLTFVYRCYYKATKKNPQRTFSETYNYIIRRLRKRADKEELIKHNFY